MYLLLTLQLAFQIIVAQVCVCLLVCLSVCCMCLGPSAVCAGTEERLPVVGVGKSWSEKVRRRGAGGWVGEGGATHARTHAQTHARTYAHAHTRTHAHQEGWDWWGLAGVVVVLVAGAAVVISRVCAAPRVAV